LRRSTDRADDHGVADPSRDQGDLAKTTTATPDGLEDHETHANREWGADAVLHRGQDDPVERAEAMAGEGTGRGKVHARNERIRRRAIPPAGRNGPVRSSRRKYLALIRVGENITLRAERISPVPSVPPTLRRRLPFLFAGFLSFLFSVYLYFVADEQTAGIFVGLWVPSIHSLGTLLLTAIEQPTTDQAEVAS
jgi:hypothetical protein